MITNYAFQPRRWNNRFDDLQTVTGLYGAIDEETGDFLQSACNAGFLCNHLNQGEPPEGGGAYMVTASDGSKKLYACNPCDVERLSDAKNTWAVGVETLGLGLPLGKKGPFTEVKDGETYAFGPSNFATLVDYENPIATVSDGLLVGASELDSSFAGWYFEVDMELGIDAFVEGNYNAFSRYNLVAHHI